MQSKNIKGRGCCTDLKRQSGTMKNHEANQGNLFFWGGGVGKYCFEALVNMVSVINFIRD